jgi:hypothetical protein
MTFYDKFDIKNLNDNIYTLLFIKCSRAGLDSSVLGAQTLPRDMATAISHSEPAREESKIVHYL